MGPPTGRMDGDAASRITKLDEVLRQVPYQYQNRDKLRNDVANLLRSCHTLQPMSGTFSGNGRQVTLFYLYGVLPISYRGATYNIPVTVYFDPPYPRSAPRCFVTPTGKMAVTKNHPNVDQGGMVVFPYLSSWNDRCCLVDLVAAMSSLFCVNPPVYSTEHSASHSSHARPQSSAQQASGESSGLMGAIGGFLGMGQQPTPQPPTAVATPVQPVRPVQPTPPVVAAHVVARPVQAGGPQGSRKDVLVRKATEALKERWRFVVEPLVEEANGQLERRAELRGEAEKVEEQLAILKAEEARHQEQVQQVEALEAQLGAFVAANEGKEPDPDDLREDLDADSRQVLDLLAEELSLEEFLVAMDELLAARKISIDDFMREVRDVSRRRFMCQVLRQKSEAAVRRATEEAAPAPTVVIARPVTDDGRRVLVASG